MGLTNSWNSLNLIMAPDSSVGWALGSVGSNSDSHCEDGEHAALLEQMSFKVGGG